jgi:hypothetical protein
MQDSARDWESIFMIDNDTLNRLHRVTERSHPNLNEVTA